MCFLRLMWFTCLVMAATSVVNCEELTELEMLTDAEMPKQMENKGKMGNNEIVATQRGVEAVLPPVVPISVAEMNQPQIEIVKMNLRDDELQELMALDEVIGKEPAEMLDDVRENEPIEEVVLRTVDDGITRTPRNVKNQTAQAATLTNEEITEIVNMISFPKDQLTEYKETTASTEKNDANQQLAKEDVVIEPRVDGIGQRLGRKLKRRGYYIIAFSPLDGPVVPFTKIDIIPDERSLPIDEHDDDSDHDADVKGDGRILGKKKWNHYIRRMMKQIRKGTRRIQRKTRFKSNKPSTGMGDFLRQLYDSRQKKKKSSWFQW